MAQNKPNPTNAELRGEIATLLTMLDADAMTIGTLVTHLREAYGLLFSVEKEATTGHDDIVTWLDEIKAVSKGAIRVIKRRPSDAN